MNKIFIVGIPRSGTSLATQIIASHPDVTLVTKKMLTNTDTDMVETNFGFENYDNAVKLFNNLESKIKTKYIVEKTPLHFLIADEIRELFPDCQILNIYRNKYSVINSLYHSHVKNYIKNKEIDTLLDAVHYYNFLNHILKQKKFDANFDITIIQDQQYIGVQKLYEMLNLKSVTENTAKKIFKENFRIPINKLAMRTGDLHSHKKELSENQIKFIDNKLKK